MGLDLRAIDRLLCALIATTIRMVPDEVAAGAKLPSPLRGRVSYFDGRMKWYAFG